VNHPNICTLHDMGPKYLVMDSSVRRMVRCLWAKHYVSRGRLRTHLKPHTKGIVHRDLKPATSRSNPTVQSSSWRAARREQHRFTRQLALLQLPLVLYGELPSRSVFARGTDQYCPHPGMGAERQLLACPDLTCRFLVGVTPSD
jgi:hypothetical protein